MIKANFNTYNNYVTDSLYQWDINQELIINGLNLSVAPEIHFTNVNMDRAIVRQASTVGGSVKVKIPNSLLQEPFTIKAYVGIYEDDTFKVIEKIEIPVIAKTRPFDYALINEDEEVYSFKELENLVINAVDHINETIDNSVANYLELHPVTTGATEEQAQQIEENKNNIESILAVKNNYYTKSQIDNMFEGYVMAVADLIGGNA